jgi:mono/diheme cytochrome c family protein
MDSSVLIVIGVQATIVGAALVLLGPQILRRWPGAGGGLIALRTLGLIGGVALIGLAFLGGQTPMSDVPNPVDGTVVNVEAGRDLYQANCAACHGVDARGGGPLAGTTPVEPPSLVEHAGDHADGDLYYWISEGRSGGMPAWRDRLSDDERWRIVLYLRSLGEGR